MTTSHHGDDKMSLLYEASYRGSVSALNSLIQQDPLILYKISQSAFFETPLHISALLGHLDFTKALLTHKPQLALELDSSRSTALHLASAEGHNDIVKELLQAYEQACMAHDQEGRIPLHYAAMRGRTEVVRELIRAKPESSRILDNGKTIFHLCVTYNHLETLKALIMELELDTDELLNFKDFDGRTILHLAIMFNQAETIRYLFSIPKIREAASLENDTIMLTRADIKSENIRMNTLSQPPPSTTTNVLYESVRPPKEKRWKKMLKSMGNCLKYKGDWLEETRGTLSIVATVISTITFQVAINPAGGVIQQNISPHGPLECLNLPSGNETYDACPGEAMLASRYPNDFRNYLIFNTISFVASLSVNLLLVSGLPLKHRVVMWMLSIGMCITLTFLALSYFSGILMMTPDHVFDSALNMFEVSIRIWVGLLGLVLVFIIIRFLTWLVKNCIKQIKRTCQKVRGTETDLA